MNPKFIFGRNLKFELNQNKANPTSSEELMCLSIEWKLYTCRNSDREQLRKIHQL